MTRSRWDSVAATLFNRPNRQVAILVVAYLAAVGSLVSYAVVDQGTGRPSRAQFGVLLLSVVLIYYLTLQWRE